MRGRTRLKAADGRAREVSLTAKGRRLYERLWRTSEPIRVLLLADFSEQEAGQFLRFLRRLIQNANSLDRHEHLAKRTPIATT